MVSFTCHQANSNGKCRSGAISANTNVVFVDAKCLRVVVGVAKGRVAIFKKDGVLVLWRKSVVNKHHLATNLFCVAQGVFVVVARSI